MNNSGPNSRLLSSIRNVSVSVEIARLTPYSSYPISKASSSPDPSDHVILYEHARVLQNRKDGLALTESQFKETIPAQFDIDSFTAHGEIDPAGDDCSPGRYVSDDGFESRLTLGTTAFDTSPMPISAPASRRIASIRSKSALSASSMAAGS